MFKAKELRLKSREELDRMLRAERAKLSDLNFKLAGAQLKKVSEFSETRKNIAVMLTVIKEKNV